MLRFGQEKSTRLARITQKKKSCFKYACEIINNTDFNWTIVLIANLITLGHYLKGSTVWNEAATFFGHSLIPNYNLAGQSHRTKLSVNLINDLINLLLSQIKSSSLPEQTTALDQLLRIRL